MHPIFCHVTLGPARQRRDRQSSQRLTNTVPRYCTVAVLYCALSPGKAIRIYISHCRVNRPTNPPCSSLRASSNPRLSSWIAAAGPACSPATTRKAHKAFNRLRSNAGSTCCCCCCCCLRRDRNNLSICTPQHAAPRKSGLAVWVTTVAPRGVSSRSASGQLLQTEWGTRGSALCGAGRERAGGMHSFTVR